MLGKGTARRKVKIGAVKKRKLTCIGDGDGKQKEMEEGMLQQQDWQKFGHPHGAAELAGGFPLEKIPGERSRFLLGASRAGQLGAAFYCEELSLLCD